MDKKMTLDSHAESRGFWIQRGSSKNRNLPKTRMKFPPSTGQCPVPHPRKLSWVMKYFFPVFLLEVWTPTRKNGELPLSVSMVQGFNLWGGGRQSSQKFCAGFSLRPSARVFSRTKGGVPRKKCASWTPPPGWWGWGVRGVPVFRKILFEFFSVQLGFARCGGIGGFMGAYRLGNMPTHSLLISALMSPYLAMDMGVIIMKAEWQGLWGRTMSSVMAILCHQI